MSAPAPAGADLLEARMQATFGMGLREYDNSVVGRVPTAYLSEAIRIVDRSGVLPELKKWDALRRKSSAGRKAVIPLDAVLVLFLLNVRMGYGVTYLDMSRTVDRRFGLREFERLGIQNINSDGENPPTNPGLDKVTVMLMSPSSALRSRTTKTKTRMLIIRALSTMSGLSRSRRPADFL